MGDNIKGYKARPHADLISEVMSEFFPKTDREHALKSEIERLRAEVQNLGASANSMAWYKSRAEKAESLLAERDNFIVDNGLWTKFVESIRTKEALAQKETKE